MTADNILITSGSQQALDFIGRVFLNRGDYIVVESPTYLGALQAWNSYSAQYIPVRTDEDGMIVDELEAALRIGPKFIYVLPNFQNPGTASPEAFLAREAEICYATMAHVTDYDVWHVSETPVTVEMVLQTLHKNTALAQHAVQSLARNLAHKRDCECANALATALITRNDAIPPAARQKLDLLVRKYL